jgi:hypothetical protein
MGNPKNREPCSSDNLCFPTGASPKYVVASFNGIIKNPAFPLVPPPLNGSYRLVQVSGSVWGIPAGTISCSFQTGAGFSTIWLGYDPFEPCFYQRVESDCIFSFSNSVYPIYWQYGTCSVTFFGTPDTTGNDEEVARKAGIIQPETAQFENYADAALKKVLRIAQKRDGTLIHLRQ